MSQNQLMSSRKKTYIRDIRLLLAEQKFLELIEDKQHLKALKCLRLEITPLTDDLKHVQHLATLLMCKSTEDVKLKANWPGKGSQSRQLLVEKIQRFIPPLIMLPPKRLNTLLTQAVQLQKERCLLHLNSVENDNNNSREAAGPNTATTTTTTTTNDIDTYVDLKSDHICSADRFPLHSRQALDSHKTEVWVCKFSNDGTKLATGGLGGKVKIWSVDPVERKLVEDCTYDCNSFSVTCLSWSPDDAYLLVCGSEERPDLYVWNVAKREVQIIINPVEDEHVTTCSWHMSGELFAAASLKGNFVIYGIEGSRRGSREGVRVQCLSFLHKDPNQILAADTLNRIKSYAIKDMSIHTAEEDVLTERHPIMSFVVDREDKYIAVNLMEQGVHLWDLKLKTLLRMFPGVCQRNLTIYSSFSSPNSTFLASGSEDGKVYIYHLSKDQPVAILHGHSRCVNCVSWNPKYPELLVSVSDDRIIRLWAPIDSEDPTTTTTTNSRMC